MADSMHALAGIAGLLGLAWLVGENRRAVPWRSVAAGLMVQLLLAIVFLKVALVKDLFLKLNDALLVIEKATQAGTGLVFGYLGGGPAPFAVTEQSSLFILAFRALPLVLVVSALSALLFYWRVLPAVVRALSWLLEKTMRVGGVVGLSTAANVFVGMVRAPLSSSDPTSPKSRAAEAVRDHDRRHGVDRRHGAVPLRRHPRPCLARRGGAPAHRLDPLWRRRRWSSLSSWCRPASHRRDAGNSRSRPRAAWMP
jgi:hypothetical protein